MERTNARDFYHIDEADNDATCGEIDSPNLETCFAWMEAYATERVREELEAAAMSMCSWCRLRIPFCSDKECDREDVHHVGDDSIEPCTAVPIIKRLAELDAEAVSEEPRG